MMNASRRMLSLGMLCATLALGACAPKVELQVVDTTADEAAIRGVLDDITRTFNAGDYDGMFALYRDDVVVSAPGAPDTIGKEAWRTAMAATLPPELGLKLHFHTQELEVAGGLAYERGTYSIDISDKATGAALQSVTGRHIHIFRREADGSWKGWRLFENSADPVPAA